jgi:putative ABC transport system permease protein
VKFLPLLAANLFRRKIRTSLTVGSFAVALFLFGLLVTIRGAFNQGVEAAGVDRLIVMNKVSLVQPLPLAYKDRLAKVEGVKQVTFASWFGGVYQDEKNFFAQFAVDPETWREMYREFVVPDAQWEAFRKDKAAAIAGAVTAKRFGWKIGDRIPIRGAFYQGEWQFNLVGIYEGTRPQDDLSQFWFRWDYMDEKVEPYLKGWVGWYVVRLEPGSQPAVVSNRIDAQFANSSFESRTQTEQAFMGSFVEQMGNIEFLMLAIGGVVVFTLLLVTGNTMATAVRERTAELAVLKTVGFGDGFVLVLVLLESALLAAVGGTLGVVLAKAFTLRGDPTNGMLPVFYMPGWSLPAGIVLAVVVGLLAGLLPAWAAMRLQVVQALRRI